MTPVVLHGHFYQPPREDPRTGRIPDEPSAAPFANWNERIAEECYAPLAQRDLFAWLSFDLGPTLAAWLARARPALLEAMVRGDADARTRLGHGNAVAQPYHHIILPLATRAEKRTEIRWGLDDFERTFGRPARGMWLPETAVDHETLETLADEGVAFTILAPHQVTEPAPGGIARIDVGRGRSIVVFIYDGVLSHGIAFGELLTSADAWLGRIRERLGMPADEARDDAAEGEPNATGETGPVAIATDGETFGHHHPGSEDILAEVVDRLRSASDLRIENFGSVLARTREIPEAELAAPSSWSCAHGVERWRSNCGCRMAQDIEANQSWRGPLRAALQHLARKIDEAWDVEAATALADPEAARAHLGRVLGAGPEAWLRYVRAVARTDPDRADALLGAVRARSAMFTSCAWFFDDVAGLEPTQVLRYAADAIDRIATLDPARARRLERRLVSDLAAARSSDPEFAHAGEVFEGRVRGGRA